MRKGAGRGDAPIDYVAELKIDGLSIALTYVDGVLTRGVTRGDGVRGEDVTSNVRVIRAVPLRLNGGPPGTIEVRGEIYLPRRSFERVNREREDADELPFANPRNAAAGTMRTLDPALVARRGLSAYVYQLVVPGSASGRGIRTRSKRCAPGGCRWSRTGRGAPGSTRCSRTAARGRTSASRSSSTPTAS